MDKRLTTYLLERQQELTEAAGTRHAFTFSGNTTNSLTSIFVYSVGDDGSVGLFRSVYSLAEDGALPMKEIRVLVNERTEDLIPEPEEEAIDA